MDPSPLPFASPELADATAVRRITQRVQARGSDLSFANIYLLQNKYHTEICIQDGVLYRHFSGNSRLQGYAFPCGTPDATATDLALRRIEDDAAARKRKLTFCLLTDDDAALLQQLRPGQFDLTSDRGNTDYLYRQTDLSKLPGTPYHSKRNHLARFTRLCPDWRFCLYTSDLYADALCVADAWFRAAGGGDALEHENHAIRHALECAEALHLIGGLIYADKQPVALSLASIISSDAADIHYEKCHPDYRDAYPAINSCMADILAPVTYINREEDMNVEGLRKAKLSYHPALLLHKWDACPCKRPSPQGDA